MKKGYTLIEIIVAISIIAFVFAIVLANYRRGGSDSVLARETNLLMSRLRYAQELTSTGSILRYQGGAYSGSTCNCDPNALDGTPLSCKRTEQCSTVKTGAPLPWPEFTPAHCICCPVNPGTGVASDDCSQGKETPQGGFEVGFSCLNTVANYTAAQYNDPGSAYNTPSYDTMAPQIFYARSKYYLVAERIKCVGAPGWETCFPLNSVPVGEPWNSPEFDGIISMENQDYKGDTTKEKYTIDSTVQIFNLRVTYTNQISLPAVAALPAEQKESFTCADRSPWYRFTAVNAALTVPGTADKVPWDYPIQATVRFIPPDGRVVDLNDNIYEYAPTATGADPTNPVKSVEVMLKLIRRSTDCRVVTVTRTGTISQRTDADCNFAT